MGIPNDILIIVGLVLLSVFFLMAVFARLYRKAGPHEALVVYGFRGTRIIKGHRTVIFPMVESARCFARADVVRRCAATGSLHQAGRGGDGRGGRPDQGEVRSGVDP